MSDLTAPPEFHAKPAKDSVWHRLTPEEQKEVARVYLKGCLISAEYGDSDDTIAAIHHVARVFW